ncbi:hypothetical protein KKG29_05690 [Patescibacteria group bacterium]|nr:hypothetical protein [Patescibacteria group bacterium]
MSLSTMGIFRFTKDIDFIVDEGSNNVKSFIFNHEGIRYEYDTIVKNKTCYC